ncbi:uncharacterized protein LOC121380390 [Gigantopelta aegis]|uniref:uncharacterized protein LOC121380390 n=1 Tax=Gigantopelta aegis TaxID=1735272 RepID=UPI001B88B587|nr:uncharacterized protein LOC121380390 [Gigantopelta aegis]
MDSTPNVPRAQEFNDYMIVNWIDYDARFPLPLWNHHDTNGPRTNNNLEGFHNRLNKAMPHYHPNIYRFVDIIKKIEFADRAKISQIDFGAVPSRKCVYREMKNRLVRLKDQLQQRVKTPLQFLDAVGFLLKLA